MRHLCKQCAEDEGVKLFYPIAVIGTVSCNGCGIDIKNDEIKSVGDALMPAYFNRIKKAKETAREAIKEMIKNKIAPLEVYIYRDRNISLMVPINEELNPVQIIGELKNGGF